MRRFLLFLPLVFALTCSRGAYAAETADHRDEINRLLDAFWTGKEDIAKAMEKFVGDENWGAATYLANNYTSHTETDLRFKEALTWAAQGIRSAGFQLAYCDKLFSDGKDKQTVLGCYQNAYNPYKDMPKVFPYFSKEFITSVNENIKHIAIRSDEITAKYKQRSEEQETLRQERLKELERVATERKIYEDAERQKLDARRIELAIKEEAQKTEARERARLAEIKRKEEEDARVKRVEIEQEVEDSVEYKKLEVVCKICDAIEVKRNSEKEIVEEEPYSKKFGVKDLSFINGHKNRIKQSDRIIHESGVSYKKMTKHAFNSRDCQRSKSICASGLAEYVDKMVEKRLHRAP